MLLFALVVVVLACVVLRFIQIRQLNHLGEIAAQRKETYARSSEAQKYYLQIEKECVFRTTFVTQHYVDSVLSRLALHFHKVGRDEVRRQEGDHFTEYERSFNALRTEIKNAKEAFWSAHNSAREIGYQVREKYTDYLPADLSEENRSH